MSRTANLVASLRFASALHTYFAHRLTLEEAQAVLRRQAAERDASLLYLLEHAVYAHPGSPYLRLLRSAGCELGDVRDMVRGRGLEATLRSLRAAGVYLTFEESKGLTPIVREGRVLEVPPGAFDNPLLRHYYRATTAGTTSRPISFRTDLTHLSYRAAQTLVAYEAHGLIGLPLALWRGAMPESRGIALILRGARFGHVPRRWFSPVTSTTAPPSFRQRLATTYIILAARLHGLPVPFPEPVGLDQAGVIARWAGETVRAEGACLINCSVSMAVRVALAARDEGLNLAGAVFMGGGEPPTPAKVRAITESGARWVPTYSFSETGSVGFGCARPQDGNDIHLFKDGLALIQWPRQVPGWDLQVDAFCFTTLLPTAPRILLNVESDDYGTVESRSCGCPLEAYGLTEHLRHIFSFRKLTTEGLTFVGSDMIRILEEVLPARFGGTPLDYQLVEEEDETGLTRLHLLVSPRVPIGDEQALKETILRGLRRPARGYWRDAGTIRIKRMEPIWTDRGKLMPLNLVRRLSPNGEGPSVTDRGRPDG